MVRRRWRPWCRKVCSTHTQVTQSEKKLATPEILGSSWTAFRYSRSHASPTGGKESRGLERE